MEEKDESILHVGKDTGNIYGESKPKKLRRKPHTYYMEFYRNIVKSKAEVSFVMKAIIGEMDGHNLVVLDSGLKEKICNYYKINDNAIRTNLTRMIKRNLAIRKAPSVYFINPYYYTKANLFKLSELRNEYGELLVTKSKPKIKLEEPQNIIRLSK